MSKKRKLWIPIVAVVLAVAIAVSGILVWRSKSAKPVDVFPVSSVYTTYWGDSATLEGNVSDGRIQHVPLREGLVESINVQEGQEVHVGDVLMVYDVTSFQLTLQSDEARIALLESKIQIAKQDLATYQTLKPAEAAPPPTEEIIHHTAPEVATQARIDVGTAPNEEGIYYCTADTVITGAFLSDLAARGATVEFQLYQDNVIYASWLVDGSNLAANSGIVTPPPDEPTEPTEPTQPTEPAEPTEPTEPTEPAEPAEPTQPTEPSEPAEPTEPTTPTEPTQPTDPTSSEPDSSGSGSGDGSGSNTPEATSLRSPRTVKAPSATPGAARTAGFSDWTLGAGVEFMGDGTVSLDFSLPHYGTLVTYVPEEAEWDEYVYQENYQIDAIGNYAYTRQELAQMIKDTQQELASLDIDLRAARLTYQKDQMVSETGEITAYIDGTVSEVKDAASITNGETLITVKGTENFTVTAYISEMRMSTLSIGDMLDVYTYESGNSVTATVSEIGTSPVQGYFSYGEENPNNSYYPVTATVDDTEAELTVGEWCQVTVMSSGDEASAEAMYVPMMYIRSDNGGDYVMIAGENDRLVKRYVTLGKALWGSYYEIRSGLTLEDEIAFPYGKTVKEGAPLNHLEYPEYW